MNFFILIEGLLKIPFIPRDEGSGVLPPTEVVSCRATSARFQPAGLGTIRLRLRLQGWGIPAGVKLAQPELPIALTDHIWEKRLVLYSRRHTLAAARTLTPLSPDPESCTNG